MATATFPNGGCVTGSVDLRQFHGLASPAGVVLSDVLASARDVLSSADPRALAELPKAAAGASPGRRWVLDVNVAALDRLVSQLEQQHALAAGDDAAVQGAVAIADNALSSLPLGIGGVASAVLHAATSHEGTGDKVAHVAEAVGDMLAQDVPVFGGIADAAIHVGILLTRAISAIATGFYNLFHHKTPISDLDRLHFNHPATFRQLLLERPGIAHSLMWEHANGHFSHMLKGMSPDRRHGVIGGMPAQVLAQMGTPPDVMALSDPAVAQWFRGRHGPKMMKDLAGPHRWKAMRPMVLQFLHNYQQAHGALPSDKDHFKFTEDLKKGHVPA